VDHRRQNTTRPQTTGNSPIGVEKKTPKSVLECFEELWRQATGAFKQKRTWKRAEALSLSVLVCLGRHTITGLLTTAGRQFHDWTADFRLFSAARFDENSLFATLRRAVLKELPRGAPVVAAMDDTIIRKTGTKIHGVSWRRDPLGPPFRTNLVRGQRYLQISAALPGGEAPCAANMIPIDFRHCPTPLKPRKDAPKQEWIEYRKEQEKTKISKRGAEQIHALRHSLDTECDAADRLLILGVDASFTNSTVLKDMPERTILIGRIRKDAKLYHLPEEYGGKGRRRVYGKRAPTPEELRKDQSVPWKKVTAFAAGKTHEFKIKTLAPLKWRAAGGKHDLRLVVIAPLGYRLSKNSRLLYRQPGYLICMDPNMSLEEILQYYLWRWGIEVNFRDEKTCLGIGQAQVRNKNSVEKVPQLLVSSYAILLLAEHAAFASPQSPIDTLPKPKWRKGKSIRPSSTEEAVNHLRAEIWGKNLGIEHFSGFAERIEMDMKPEKHIPHLASAVCYAQP